MSSFTYEEAKGKYNEYIDAGLKMFPPFKGYGMKNIQFAIDEPDMYQMLFGGKAEMSVCDFIEQKMEMNKVLPYIMESLELNENDAKWLFRNLAIYVHGLSTLLTACSSFFTIEDLSKQFGSVCRGLMMQLNAPVDERTSIIPTVEERKAGKVEEYIKGKRNVIIGYGPDREMFQIRLDAILYFEAVGENVFAYTKQNVYEIKQRLYKIEDTIQDYHFIRASKSVLVNMKKISSISPDTGGRAQIHMLNGETVIASRSYSKDVIDKIKRGSEIITCRGDNNVRF